MELDELMRFAQAYNKLGWAIQEQLGDIVNGEYGDLNPNALKEINARMKGYNEDLDAAIEDALATEEANKWAGYLRSSRWSGIC